MLEGGNRKSCNRVGKTLASKLCMMKKTISFVLVAFLVLLGSAKSDVISAVQPNGNPTPNAKPRSVYITVPFYYTGGTYTYEGDFKISGAFESSGRAVMDAAVNVNFKVFHCIWTLTDTKGTITIHEQCETGTFLSKGRWEIVSGTGDYTNLRGNGSALMPPDLTGTGINWEVLTGVIY